ncbi:hypothetical protein VTJ83DRAFT_7158 [Remersonia thermophila]|uniref:Potassium channel domain-containing protein n=1 Tax=Remersonia thermophila TaxID=72144 RepID=A0ABR4D2U4_9PEZI
MIAGTLGPAASSFSICALVKPWQQHLPPGASIDTAVYTDDPPWLTAINATQLGIAILANMALFLNMSRRLSFTIAQPLTIAGWYTSSFALVGLTATAAGPLLADAEPTSELIWSQAFYYAIYAAVLYFLIATLMLLTYLSALNGHGPKDFALTASQRTLMLQSIMFLLYLLIGALVFTAIEGWSYLDGFYWAAVTLFTVGFGDFYPTTPLARGLLVPFALVGIISLGLVIGSIRSLFIGRGKTRLGARMLEKRRRHMLTRMKPKSRDEILVPHSHGPALTELERREREFALMRKIQDTSARRRRWGSMLVSTGSWLVVWLLGAYVFQVCEGPYQGWNYRDAFYFAFVSLTTIGYGGGTAKSNAGKSFWVFWSLMALPTMTIFISDASDTVVLLIRDSTDWVARLTILPGEDSIQKDLNKVLRLISFGLLFGKDAHHLDAHHLEDQCPESLSGTRTRADEDDTPGLLRRATTDPEAAHPRAPPAVQRRSWRAHVEQAEARGSVVNVANATDTANRPTSPPLSPHITHQPPPPPPEFRVPSYPQTRRRRARSSISSQSSACSLRQKIDLPLPSSKHDYLVTLISEIRRLTRHLKRDPPRKYSFREWMWYLKLIGEDEADASRHRRVSTFPCGPGSGRGGRQARRGDGPKQRKGDNQTPNDHATSASDHGNNTSCHSRSWGPVTSHAASSPPSGSHGIHHNWTWDPGGPMLNPADTTSNDGGDQTCWSWVGHRSPLMSLRNESEWILDRLTARLEEELKRVKVVENYDDDDDDDDEEDERREQQGEDEQHYAEEAQGERTHGGEPHG